ncbi:MAG: carbamoyltransferase family protein [Planctomycetota bacterium]|jgi:carbamoyltransferase
MNILGFNSTHDASAALVRDGEIVCAVEEERFTRQKHHYGFPDHAIRACLKAGGIEVRDLDHVAFYWNPKKGLLPFMLHVARHFPKTLAFFDHQPGIWKKFMALKRLFREEYGFDGPFHFPDHHGNHIASAFWPSPFDEAAALTIDGTGEWSTTVMAHVEAGGRRRVLRTMSYPHSIGKLWETLTQYLGFRPNSGEGKVMGLAPYGRPTLLEKFRDVVKRGKGGRFKLNLRYLDFHYGRPRKYSDLFVETFGPPREPESEIDSRHEDVAYALQAMTEELILDITRALHELTGSPRLVMAGGVALNSVANGRIQRETPFTDIFVQPSAGDAGAALGAALRVWHEILGRGDEGRFRMVNAFHGPEYSEEEMIAALEDHGLTWSRSENAPREAAERIARGEIIGWFQGKMEYGPRALGNRSILADARGPDTKDIVNARVKHREPFRPFAPAVTAEAAPEYFETGGAEAPFMLKVFPVREEKREVIPAVTHVDGSARVQTVRPEQNQRYYDIIRSFGEITGVPVILNTSFNIRGEPIVCTPADAVACYLGTGLDALILGDLVTAKPPSNGK